MAERDELRNPERRAGSTSRTSDSGAAKQFYGELFGWTYNDQPVDEVNVYSMAQCARATTSPPSAVSENRPRQGVPPH